MPSSPQGDGTDETRCTLPVGSDTDKFSITCPAGKCKASAEGDAADLDKACFSAGSRV